MSLFFHKKHNSHESDNKKIQKTTSALCVWIRVPFLLLFIDIQVSASLPWRSENHCIPHFSESSRIILIHCPLCYSVDFYLWLSCAFWVFRVNFDFTTYFSTLCRAVPDLSGAQCNILLRGLPAWPIGHVNYLLLPHSHSRHILWAAVQSSLPPSHPATSINLWIC